MLISFFCKCNACLLIQELLKDRGGRDCMVVGLITNCAISVYHHQRCEFEICSGKVYSIHHYVINFVSDLQQIGDFRRFPPTKLTA
jgi:hypothetical protein